MNCGFCEQNYEIALFEVVEINLVKRRLQGVCKKLQQRLGLFFLTRECKLLFVDLDVEG